MDNRLIWINRVICMVTNYGSACYLRYSDTYSVRVQ